MLPPEATSVARALTYVAALIAAVLHYTGKRPGGAFLIWLWATVSTDKGNYRHTIMTAIAAAILTATVWG